MGSECLRICGRFKSTNIYRISVHSLWNWLKWNKSLNPVTFNLYKCLWLYLFESRLFRKCHLFILKRHLVLESFICFLNVSSSKSSSKETATTRNYQNRNFAFWNDTKWIIWSVFFTKLYQFQLFTIFHCYRYNYAPHCKSEKQNKKKKK